MRRAAGQTLSGRRGRWLLAVACVLPLVVLTGCDPIPSRQASEGGPFVIASIYPLALILTELGGDSLAVQTLLPAGATPHVYEPKPSTVRRAGQALAVFYVSDELDGWAARLDAASLIEVIALLPPSSLLPTAGGHGHNKFGAAHGHGAVDAHFWTDPLLVRELLPALAQGLAQLDPANAGKFQANAEEFARELTELDGQIASLLADLPSRALLMQHPSFQYFARRYRLEIVGFIEVAPGKEPSPAHLEELVSVVRQHGVRAVSSEPQMPAAAAQAVAEAAGLPLFTLDPLGSSTGSVSSYSDLLLYNTRQLVLNLGSGSPADGSG
jgi:zinc transport system substrate-binding protein